MWLASCKLQVASLQPPRQTNERTNEALKQRTSEQAKNHKFQRLIIIVIYCYWLFCYFKLNMSDRAGKRVRARESERDSSLAGAQLLQVPLAQQQQQRPQQSRLEAADFYTLGYPFRPFRIAKQPRKPFEPTKTHNISQLSLAQNPSAALAYGARQMALKWPSPSEPPSPPPQIALSI